VRRSCPVRLWLLGDSRAAAPAYVEKLRERARSLGIDDVFWSGRLDSADVSAHLQACDVFVLPQADGHLTRSSAFMAAAAHGLPVIAVRNPGNQQEFTHGRDVWLAEKSSSSAFSEALGGLLVDPQLRFKLGGNLRKLYEEKFDWAVATRPAGGISSAPVISEEPVARKLNLEKTQVRKA